MSDTGSAIITAACLIIFYLSVTHLADHCDQACNDGIASTAHQAAVLFARPVGMATGLAAPATAGLYLALKMRHRGLVLLAIPGWAIAAGLGFLPVWLAFTFSVLTVGFVVQGLRDADVDDQPKGAP